MISEQRSSTEEVVDMELQCVGCKARLYVPFSQASAVLASLERTGAADPMETQAAVLDAYLRFCTQVERKRAVIIRDETDETHRPLFSCSWHGCSPSGEKLYKER